MHHLDKKGKAPKFNEEQLGAFKRGLRYKDFKPKKDTFDKKYIRSKTPTLNALEAALLLNRLQKLRFEDKPLSGEITMIRSREVIERNIIADLKSLNFDFSDLPFEPQTLRSFNYLGLSLFEIECIYYDDLNYLIVIKESSKPFSGDERYKPEINPNYLKDLRQQFEFLENLDINIRQRVSNPKSSDIIYTTKNVTSGFLLPIKATFDKRIKKNNFNKVSEILINILYK